MSFLDKFAMITLIIANFCIIAAFFIFFTPIITHLANQRTVTKTVVITATPTMAVMTPTATPTATLKSSIKKP